jgi:UDP-N-acetyl-2-amino-2-deoxyglucuronate dehydrogenase
MEKRLSTAVVGLIRGKGLCYGILQSKGLQLNAVCDTNADLLKDVAAATGGPAAFADYETMLAQAKPEVVVVATPTALHAKMVLQAVSAGVKGIYCEKPMAVNMADARAMVEACAVARIPFIIGHQRRMSTAFRTMRRLIAEGAVGEVYLIRGACPGDILNDVAHTVDNIRFLNGDDDVKWVFGQINRNLGVIDPVHMPGRPGWRYGHPVETGSMATFEFANGVRAEMLSGDLRVAVRNPLYPGWAYQDIEVFGTKGRLWRNGDNADPPLRIWDEKGGWRAVSADPLPYQPGKLIHADDPAVLAYCPPVDHAYILDELARFILKGGTHTLDAANVMKGFEVLMAVLESARLRKKIELPLRQDRYPLEIMMEEGQL